MDIAALQNVSTNYLQEASVLTGDSTSTNTFDTVLKSAMNMVSETNQLENNAESEEIKFALGESDNTHDLQIAQQKANIALQYTVAVRDRVIDAYKEIMNMSI